MAQRASRSPSTRPIDLLRFAGSKQLSFEPGSQWSYSNTNYIALGLVIERVTGNSYAHELEQRLFDPLGLDDTELPTTRLLPDLGDDGALTPVPVYPKGRPVYDVDWANPIVSWAAGGIVSNARDISRFYSALLSGQILSSASLAKMKETDAAGAEGGHGLGIVSVGSRCGRSWVHGGGILDYGTFVGASEKGDRVGVISVYGRVLSRVGPEESALVCPEYRLAESAAASKIAFIRTPNELSVTNADGTERRKLTGNAALGTPAWSPDGKKIASVGKFGGYSEVYVMNADGGPQRLARGNAPDWSPDGLRIAFARKVAWGAGGVGGQFEIFVMNGDGSGQRRLTRNLSGDFHPAWSPDGRKIVFESRGVAAGGGNSSGWYDVYVVNADGSGQPTGLTKETRPVRNRAPRAALPAWSPDGRMIAFLSWNDDNYDVYVMNADGSGQTNVTRSRANESRFAWSPKQTKGA